MNKIIINDSPWIKEKTPSPKPPPKTPPPSPPKTTTSHPKYPLSYTPGQLPQNQKDLLVRFQRQNQPSNALLRTHLLEYRLRFHSKQQRQRFSHCWRQNLKQKLGTHVEQVITSAKTWIRTLSNWLPLCTRIRKKSQLPLQNANQLNL